MNKNQNQFGIIAIVGLMGVGKTTIGAKLAERLQCYFIDSDQEIEDIERQTIPEIFAKKGEKYFREIEKNLIKEIIKRGEDIVLSLGGGAFVDDEVRELLKEKATTIWLCADIDDILIRVSGKTNRPLLQNTDKRAVLENLARKRYSLYSQADLKFDTSAESHEVIIRKIIQNLNDVTRQKEKSVIEKKVAVALEERSYDILVGNKSLQNLADFLQKKSYSKIITITDENVAKHHLARLEDVLAAAEKSCEKIIVKAGEQTKSFHFLEKICEEILAKNIDRKSLIIAFGGGVIGDLSGFIASILLRGIDFVQIPTTLLSMVDSSVGGKTAINSRSGKNLIGSFYQPKLVICDLSFLKTLPARELKSGYAEVVKYGFIYDKIFYEFLEKNCDRIFRDTLNFDEEIMAQIITRSCEIKAEIVGQDEKENGIRALLNFGHTFGHIFETETNYSSELLHGEAVSMGMVMAAKMSQKFGHLSEADFLRLKSHLQKIDLVIDPRKIRKNWNEKNLISHLYKDKKHENKSLNFILLEAVGKAFVKKGVSLEKFEEVLREFLIAN